MHSKQLKLENPVRLAELKPVETLQRIGLTEHHVLCDIGAGTGVFTIPAAKLTKNTVYALDISDEMLAIIREKVTTEKITNVELVKVEGERLNLTAHSVDIALLVTVLHEILDKRVFLTEIKRILREEGRLVVIEFHKKETPMGPPLSHRLGKDDTLRVMTEARFKANDYFDLGDNLYGMVFF